MPGTVHRVLLSVVGALLGLGGVTSAAVAASAEIRLHQVSSRDGLVVVRAIAGTDDIEVLDEETLRVEDAPERLRLAETVLEMIDPPPEQPRQVRRHEAGDGSVVLSAPLRDASPRDVMSALRSELRIRRVAVMEEPPTIVVRDSDEQVEAALKLVRRLDGTQARDDGP